MGSKSRSLLQKLPFGMKRYWTAAIAPEVWAGREPLMYYLWWRRKHWEGPGMISEIASELVQLSIHNMVYLHCHFEWNRMSYFSSLTHGRFKWNFQRIIFKLIVVIDGWGIYCEIVLISMSLDLTTLIQVTAWCRPASSYYLSQCRTRSMSQYAVTRHWCANHTNEIAMEEVTWLSYV